MSNNKNRIGILGGTFNPIHSGHLSLAWYAKNELNLDNIWIMPTKCPPHKDVANIVPDDIRCELIKLAIQDCPDFTLNDLELKRSGTTYTADTMIYLHENYNHDFYFILGADSLLDIEKWNRPEIIMNFSSIIVAVRDSCDTSKLKSHADYLKSKYNAKVYILKMPLMDISSNQIRQSIQLISDFNRFSVPEKVYNYIINNGIYTTSK